MMKKLISMLLVLAICAALACPVLAAGDDFVPSVTYKPAPGFAETETEEGDVVGYAYDEDGNVIGSVLYEDGRVTVTANHEGELAEDHVCLVVTPLSEAETSTEIPDEAAQLLLEVYELLLANGMKLFGECEGLDAAVAAALGEGKTAEDLVVRDLFDVSVLCDELEEYLKPEGTTICLDFDLDLAPDTFVAVVAYKGGQWKMIDDVEILENGDVLCTTYENFCPVAILVPEADAAVSAPHTGDTMGNNVVLWTGVMALSLAGIVVLTVLLRKRSAGK